MRQKSRLAGFRVVAVLWAGVVPLLAPSALSAASATALVSATVLGPAETDIAAGAVTISKVAEADGVRLAVATPGRPAAPPDRRSLSAYRLAGGFHASYTVALPGVVTVKSGGAEFSLSGFAAHSGNGRLAADGTATFGVSVSLAVPAGQAPGVYTGSYPVTVAFN